MIGFVGIFVFCVLLSLLVWFLFFYFVCYERIHSAGVILSFLVGAASLALFCRIGIELDNNEHKVFVSSYNAQKFTIEQSLKNGALSGFERIELVKQASELNSELAERKTRIQQWNYFHVDDSIYDGVEYIVLEV